ncbi:hypothetical protein BDV26DRAFT_295531 [Aspergillus bertholletiae]|uniref:Uncharacterized protein n=1 Tax=Aspergillus bertholletiae TaxID=1226010 RepID=A0A5N7B0Q1_9EURO|nr:hypothetical protein BDV26DRAFT_295531 [Aspergillus bertholletiae]
MGSVNEILKLLDKKALVEVASLLAGTPACQLDNNSPITSPGYIIFIISFHERDERWAARIPLNQEDSFLQTRIRPIQLAHRCPDVTAPRIHGYFDCSDSGDNPVSVGYMLLDWIEGSVLDQIADLLLNMMNGCPLDDTVLFYVSSTGIVTSPYHCKRPQPPPNSSRMYPARRPPGLPETHAYLDFAADKSYFLSILAEKERQRTSATVITQLMAPSSERNFFEMSSHRVPVYREFVARFCPRTRENAGTVLKEIERFLDINPMFRADDEVIVETVRVLEALLC